MDQCLVDARWIASMLITLVCGGLGGSALNNWLSRPTIIVGAQYNRLQTARRLGRDAVRFDLTNPRPRPITVVALGFKAKHQKAYNFLADDAYVTGYQLSITLGDSLTCPIYVERSYFPPFDTIEYLIAKDSNKKTCKTRKMPLAE